MKKWITILVILFTLGLSTPMQTDVVHATNLQQQMRQNQQQLLGLWLQEEAIVVAQLMEIDRRLQFRMPRHIAMALMEAKRVRLQKLSYIRLQITNISMALYGRPRP